MATIHFLGTGNALASPRRQNTSLAIAHHDIIILVDCSGNPVASLERSGLPPQLLGHVVLTHRHTDHIYGVPSLVHQLFLQHQTHPRGPLTFIGESDAIDAARGLLQATGLWNRPGCFPIETQIIAPSGEVRSCGGIELEFFPVSHGPTPTFGIAWAARGQHRAFVYSSDTSPVDVVWKRARTGALLVHECNSYAHETQAGHTTIGQILPHAARVECEIVLVHLPPSPPEEEAVIERKLADQFGRRVVLGRDGMSVRLD